MNKVNIGSNSFVGDGWLNLDHPSQRYGGEQKKVDIPLDLSGGHPFPLEDESLCAAYTSHTIEHLSDIDVETMFYEVYRTLEEGGVFRVTCPDIRKCYDAYISSDHDYIGGWLANPQGRPLFKSMGLGEQLLFIIASNLSPFSKRNEDLKKLTDGINVYTEEEISYIFDSKNREEALTYFTEECQRVAGHLQKSAPGNHMSWWDFEKIKNLMEDVGFLDVKKQEFNESDYEVFLDFDEKNKDSVVQKPYTVFMEARK